MPSFSLFPKRDGPGSPDNPIVERAGRIVERPVRVKSEKVPSVRQIASSAKKENEIHSIKGLLPKVFKNRQVLKSSQSTVVISNPGVQEDKQRFFNHAYESERKKLYK